MGQSSWVPIFDGEAVAHAHQRTERYWPIGLMRNELMCLVVKGSNKAPYFPRPPVDNVGLRMPTTHYETEVGQLEEKHLRIHYMTLHEKAEQQAAGLEDEYDMEFSATDLEMDKALLSLIQVKRRIAETFTSHTDFFHLPLACMQGWQIATCIGLGICSP